MYVGLVISVLFHAALLGWALITIHRAPEDRPPLAEPVTVALVTPDELTRLKQGDRNAKQLEAEAKEAPKPDQPEKEAPKPKPLAATEPPPQPPEVKPEPPKPPEPATAEPTPDPIAQKMTALAKEPPPTPEPVPGPTPEAQRQIEEKLEQERVAEEQRQKAAEEAAKKKAAEEQKKKQLAEKKKKEDEARRKKAEEAKKKEKDFNADKLAALLNKIPDKSGAPAAAVEKSETPSKAKGPVAGAPEGRDNRLTASETALLAQAIRQGVQPCWRVLGGGQGADATAVKMRIQFNQDGTLKSEPQVMNAQATPFFMAAAESAKRAVINCQPYNLPAAKYAAWQDVILNFDPKDMF